MVRGNSRADFNSSPAILHCLFVPSQLIQNETSASEVPALCRIELNRPREVLGGSLVLFILPLRFAPTKKLLRRFRLLARFRFVILKQLIEHSQLESRQAFRKAGSSAYIRIERIGNL